MSDNVETVKVVNLSELEPIASGESIDLNKHHKKEVVIEKAEIQQVKSNYTDCGNQWVLKVSSEIVETLGEGEDKIEFRASELFNLIQDKEGKLKGYPESKDSNLAKFMKDIGIEKPEEITGKKATVKAYDKEVEGNVKTYLKFLY